MTAKTQSRLLTQLMKQQFKPQTQKPYDKKLEDLYQTICKQQPNNLKLLEFLMLSLERKLLTNAHGLKTFSEIFEQFTHKPIESESISITLANNSSINSEEEKKFHKQRFLKLWPQLAKKTHPGDQYAYQNIYYQKLASNQIDENRMRIDDNVKKFITKQNIKYLLSYEKSLQQIFTMYMPQNYNKKMRFTWNQLRLLNKRLPILCCFRFLYDAEICPNIFSSSSFFEILSKSLPPSNTNHRQILFYNSQTISNYIKDYITNQTIKLLEGDAGLSFHQFQLTLIRLAIEINRQIALKGDIIGVVKKLLQDMIGLKPDGQNKSPKSNCTVFINKMQNYQQKQTHHRHQKISYKNQTNNNSQTKDKISHSSKFLSSQTQIGSKSVVRDIQQFKRILDTQTPPITQPIVVEKQNEGVYNLSEKCIVIGQQPPKIVEKVRIAPRQNKKPVDEFLGQRPQIPVEKIESNIYFKQMLNPSNKPMKNNAFYPILLSQTLSPKDLIQNAQLYVETAFINLYQHNYDKAKQHLSKAKDIQKTLSIDNKVFFLYVQGQVCQSMGHDQQALDLYFRCLDTINVHCIKQNVSQKLKALPFCGIGGCLYHASEFQYALRSFLKAQQLYKAPTNNQQQYADLLNNLGCCYLKLQRGIQSRRCFEQSYNILNDLLGVYHERTLVVLQNLNKAKKCYVQRIPEYKSMWKTFTRKAGLPPPKKK